MSDNSFETYIIRTPFFFKLRAPQSPPLPARQDVRVSGLEDEEKTRRSISTRYHWLAAFFFFFPLFLQQQMEMIMMMITTQTPIMMGMVLSTLILMSGLVTLVLVTSSVEYTLFRGPKSSKSHHHC